MKIRDFFISITNILKASKEQKYLLKNLQQGDMVWARMPLPDCELRKIKESHRIRPYLVMWKDFGNIYTYQSSSKRKSELNNYEKYRINGLRYDNKKDSWIDLTKIIKVPVNCLMRKFCFLRKPDFMMIEKRLKIQMNRNKEIKKTFNVSFRFIEGDIIIHNSTKYYIFTNNNGKIYCYMLTKKLNSISDNVKKVKINGKLYYIYFDNRIVIDENASMEIVDIATVDEVLEINRLKKKIKPKKKSVVNIEAYKTGTVFKVKNKEIMYLYESNGSCYGVDLLMYKAFPKVVSIYKPSTREILEIYDDEKVNGIIKYLVRNLEQPNKRIRKMYEEICT